jgi:restriction system protein
MGVTRRGTANRHNALRPNLGVRALPDPKPEPADTRITPGTARIQLEGVSSKITGVFLPPSTLLLDAGLLMQTVVELGPKTDDGHIIEAVTLPWFAIVEALQKDPAMAFQMTPRMWEEMVAGAYERARFDEVILTPRSGDLGRDVIAIKRGLGTIRVIDQVKAKGPGHLVTANDVRALLGVLDADGASKGFLTTTSDFAPRLPEDRLLKKYMGSQLELVNGTQLLARLKELAKK